MYAEVNLPKSHIPFFPRQCTVCGKKDPQSIIKISDRSIGWWSLLSISGQKFIVDVPACDACRNIIRRQRIIRLSIEWGLVILGIAAGIFIFGYTTHFRRWIIFVIIIICCLPTVLWEVFSPRIIDITVYGNSVDYEFRDHEYAKVFAQLNGAEVK